MLPGISIARLPVERAAEGIIATVIKDCGQNGVVALRNRILFKILVGSLTKGLVWPQEMTVIGQ
jgi:hypothetical protein